MVTIHITAEFGPVDAAGAGRLRLLDYPHTDDVRPVEDFGLRVSHYDGATAVPLEYRRGRRKNIGAVYDSAGMLIEETQRAKPRRDWWPTPVSQPHVFECVRTLGGQTYYGGRYVTHFGHILLETLTRFWPMPDLGDYDHVLVAPKFLDPRWSGVTAPLFDQLTALVGVDPARVVVATEPVRVDHVDIPDSPFRVAVAADPRFLDVYDAVGARLRRLGTTAQDAMPRRIYLSRTRLRKQRKGIRAADNERAVELMFEEAGFTIVHPQTLPLAEQVALVHGADVIAGLDGSALHLALFARPGARLLALDGRSVANQFLIERARGIAATHLWAVAGSAPNHASLWTVDLERARLALDIVLDQR